MVEDWKKKDNPGKPVVGYLGWDNPAGREFLMGGKEYAEKVGVKLVQPEFYPPGSLKHDVWLTRLAGQGINYLFIEGVAPSHTNVIRDAIALGLRGKIQMVCDYWGPLETTDIKSYPNDLEGSIILSPYIRGEDLYKHSVGVKIWTKYRKEPLSEMNMMYLSGISQGMLYESALKVALKDVGYEKLDGEAMYHALQKLTGTDVTQGQMGTIDFSPTSRRVSRQVKFYKITGGKVVAISGWLTAPDCVSLYKY
jgi:ABC-type branched-subunit amino acid transport system substrate-binding protein